MVWSLTFIASLLLCIHHFNTGVTMIKLTRDMVTISDDPYVIETSDLPEDGRFNPTIANGYLGHAIYSNTIYMNGLYNGEKGDSHRARIPGTLPYIDIEKSIFIDTENLELKTGYLPKYVLDMRNGTYSQIFEIDDMVSGESLCVVSQTFYAHRYLTRVLVTEISVKFKMDGTLKLMLKPSSGDPSTDIDFKHFMKEIPMDEIPENIKMSCGSTLIPEQPGMSVLPVCYISSDFPGTLTLDGLPGKVFDFTYLTSISDTVKETDRFFRQAFQMVKNGVLQTKHQEEWQKTWKSASISLKSQSGFYSSSFVSSLYYLLSAFPPPSVDDNPYHFFGASPGGLTNGGENQDYWGHVFWDQDFWMLPALLPLFPDVVKHGLEYRIARLDKAKLKADRLGFKGAMYPWESAYTGQDVCPGESYILYEQHVTGDLIHTLKQYVYATGDWNFLQKNITAFPPSGDGKSNTAWNLTYETAKFWYSRAVWNKDKNLFVINNVMGPDEYYAPVNNSVFTNIVARQNLKFSIEAADALNIKLPEKENFQKVADNILILYDPELDYHPEFDGYNSSDMVKQADTIMLGFPLMSEMSTSSRENDLRIYSNTTDPNGPAMTWSMFAINWNDLGHDSMADEYFLRQHGNIQSPFQIWAEEANGGGAVNFLTGMGGYLQSFFYGYLNLRIYRKYMTMSPRLLPSLEGKAVTEVTVSGLKFHGAVFNIHMSAIDYTIILAGFSSKQHFFVILQTSHGDDVLKNIGDKASFPVPTTCRISLEIEMR